MEESKVRKDYMVALGNIGRRCDKCGGKDKEDDGSDCRVTQLSRSCPFDDRHSLHPWCVMSSPLMIY
jgi:hypothetical protein